MELARGGLLSPKGLQFSQSLWGYGLKCYPQWCNRNKEPEECRETSSQVKRRRLLQFDTQSMASSLCGEKMTSAFLKSIVQFHVYILFDVPITKEREISFLTFPYLISHLGDSGMRNRPMNRTVHGTSPTHAPKVSPGHTIIPSSICVCASAQADAQASICSVSLCSVLIKCLLNKFNIN